MVLTAPLSLSWGDLLDRIVAERGSLAEVVRVLYDLHPRHLPPDPGTVERGLRRLRGRGHAPGEKYGQLLLRSFGLPLAVGQWAAALGTYHGPLLDMPLALRREQLRLWDRPPLLESAHAAWIHLALASLAYQDGLLEDTDRRLALAALGLGRAGPAAEVEWTLFQARRTSDQGQDAAPLLAACPPLLAAVASAAERACFEARWLDQRAYSLTCRGRWRQQPEALAAAEALYRQIPEVGDPFVVYRHHHGLAWVCWRRGALDAAAAHARRAVEAAGDGGLRRLRAAALQQWAHIEPAAAEGLRARAADILRRLEGAPED